jgi:thioesterase domain-containing protein
VDFSVEQLAREHLRDMRTVQPNGPYILVGHSFGGLIAWEMAVQLIESGATVAFLALLDTPHPHFLGTLSPEEREVALRVYRTDRMQKYLYNLKRGRLDLLMTGAVGYVSNKTRLRAWAAWQRARRAFGRSAPAKGSLILRIDDIWHKYAPPTLDIRLLQVRAQGRDAEFAGDATMGWRKLALKGVDVQFSPGLHQYMTKDPHAIHLAQLLIPYILALRGSAESQRVC